MVELERSTHRIEEDTQPPDLLSHEDRRRIERVERWGLTASVAYDTSLAIMLSLLIGLGMGILLRFSDAALGYTLLISFVIPLIVRPFFAYRATQLILKLNSAERTMTSRASTDQLTGAYTKATFKQMVSGQLASNGALENEHSMILFDIDNFKDVNERFGHMAGDQVLEQLGRFIQSRIRGGDIFGRFGGDEFMLFLPEQSQESAMQIAERLRTAIADLQIPFAEEMISLTISMGVSSVERETLDQLDDMLARADKGLMHAKSVGGNHIFVIDLTNE